MMRRIWQWFLDTIWYPESSYERIEPFEHHGTPKALVADIPEEVILNEAPGVENPVKSTESQPVEVTTSQEVENAAIPATETESPVEVRPTPAWKPRRVLIPRICVTKAVMQEMFSEVLEYPREETSWGIWGIKYPDSSVAICGILKPRRHQSGRAVTVFGSEDHAREVQWLMANFREMYPGGSHKLLFLYKGHSHHQLGVRQYSSTDHSSLKDAFDMGMEIAIGPLANIDMPGVWFYEKNNEPGTIQVTLVSQVSFHFYVKTQEMKEAGHNNAMLVTPQVIENAGMRLPPSCWVFEQSELYSQEVQALQEYGCTIRVGFAPGYRREPLRTIFELNKHGWRTGITVSTEYNYPRTRAKIRPTGEIPDRVNLWPTNTGHGLVGLVHSFVQVNNWEERQNAAVPGVRNIGVGEDPESQSPISGTGQSGVACDS